MAKQTEIYDVPAPWVESLSKHHHRAVAVRAVFRLSRTTAIYHAVPKSRQTVRSVLDVDGVPANPSGDIYDLLHTVISACVAHMARQSAARLDYGLEILGTTRDEEGTEIAGEETIETCWKGGSMLRSAAGAVAQDPEAGLTTPGDGWASLVNKYEQIAEIAVDFAKGAAESTKRLMEASTSLLNAAQPTQTQQFAERAFFHRMAADLKLDLAQTESQERAAKHAIDVLGPSLMQWVRQQSQPAAATAPASGGPSLADDARTCLAFLAPMRAIIGDALADQIAGFLGRVSEPATDAMRADWRRIFAGLIPHTEALKAQVSAVDQPTRDAFSRLTAALQ